MLEASLMFKKKAVRLAKNFLTAMAVFTTMMSANVLANVPVTKATQDGFSRPKGRSVSAPEVLGTKMTGKESDSLSHAPLPAKNQVQALEGGGSEGGRQSDLVRTRTERGERHGGAGQVTDHPSPAVKSNVFKKDGKSEESSDGGFKLSSTGGLSYKNPKDQRYWFEFSGVMRLDETNFSGTYRDKTPPIPNSGFIRLIETYAESGLGENWLSVFGLTYSGSNNRVAITDTWIGYTGFAKNIEINIGRNSGNWFGLENSSGTGWNPFMERSLQANAFYPGDGLGILGDIWWDNGELTLIFVQPDHGVRVVDVDNLTNVPVRGDRWRGIARATYSPLHEKGNVWHTGVSFAYRQNDIAITGTPFDGGLRAQPGLKGRNVPFLLNTGFLRSSYARQFNFEAARQCGPFMIEGEYTEAYVHRERSLGESLRFHGYSVQVRYILTGESHNYDVRDGAFGKIDFNSPYGAYEVAARYDFLNLNSKNVRGGSQHNVTLGFNWFINNQLRFSLNYIRANIRPARLSHLPRHLDIFGARFQIRFK